MLMSCLYREDELVHVYRVASRVIADRMRSPKERLASQNKQKITTAGVIDYTEIR